MATAMPILPMPMRVAARCHDLPPISVASRKGPRRTAERFGAYAALAPG